MGTSCLKNLVVTKSLNKNGQLGYYFSKLDEESLFSQVMVAPSLGRNKARRVYGSLAW